MMSDTPVVTSASLGWSGLRFSGWEGVSPREAFEPSLSNHLLVIHTSPKPVKVFEKADGYRGEGLAGHGDINLFSSGDMSFCRWDNEISFLRLDLPPSFIRKVAEDLELPAGASGSIDFGRHIRLNDDRILHLVKWLNEELRNGGVGGKLYADSLMRMLSVHLLHHYCTISVKRKAEPVQHKLSRKQLDGVLQFIHAHLEQNIALEDLAAAAHMSASHLIRLFKATTGMSPHQYVIRERIRKAQTLLGKGLTILDVSSKLGFSDQSHLHRHFKKITGVTPKEFISRFH